MSPKDDNEEESKSKDEDSKQDKEEEDKNKEGEDKDKEGEDKDKEGEDKDKEGEDKDKDGEDKDKEGEDKEGEGEDGEAEGIEELFEKYSRFGDREADGTTITLKNIDKWLKQAEVMDEKEGIVKHADTAVTFAKISKMRKRINFDDFKDFMESLAEDKGYEKEDLMSKLEAAGEPQMSNVTQAISSGRVGEHIKRMTNPELYTGSQKQKSDENAARKKSESEEKANKKSSKSRERANDKGSKEKADDKKKSSKEKADDKKKSSKEKADEKEKE